MTYSQFLLVFLVVPITFLVWAIRRYMSRPQAWMLTLLSLVALIYTTPWDNYLVATRVWYYEPDRVLGITLGWVPLEEYLFFVLQPILGGLWMLYLYRCVPSLDAPIPDRPTLRWSVVSLVGLMWLSAIGLLLTNWQPARYLGLELAWALPPLMLQLAFGADILWHQRGRLILALLPLIVYFCAADTLAIAMNIWTINPAFSLQVYLGGVLPIEEFVFFALTNILITFSLGLLLAAESHSRLRQLLNAACAQHSFSKLPLTALSVILNGLYQRRGSQSDQRGHRGNQEEATKRASF